MPGYSILPLLLLSLTLSPLIHAFGPQAPVVHTTLGKPAVAIHKPREWSFAGAARALVRGFQTSRGSSRDGVTSLAMLKYPDAIGKQIPGSFTEGKDYLRDGRNLGTGDLVLIQRSDGR